MLRCEGYQMFRGKMLITPTPPPGHNFPPFEVEGDWLYKPEYDCWYCNGSSYMAKICTILEDFTNFEN